MEQINNQPVNSEQQGTGQVSFRLPKKNLIIIGGIVLVFIVVLLFSWLVQNPANNTVPETGNTKNRTNESNILPTQVSGGRTGVIITQQPVKDAAMQAALEEANRAASEYDTWQAENLNDYPWLRKLPIADENYYFYFDIGKKTFIGKLYPKPGENIEQTKAAILQQAQSKEVRYENYPIQWLVNP